MKNSARIQALKEAGYIIKVAHLRRDGNNPHDTGVYAKHLMTINGQTPSARGGMTIVRATGIDGLVAVSVARCSPRDNFNKRLGLTIALNRLEKTLAS